MQPYPTHMLCSKGTPGTPTTPLTVGVSPSSGSVGSSGSQAFTASASGGTGPYSYSWSASATSGAASVSGSGASVTVSWSGLNPGEVVYVTCNATDSLGATGSGAASLGRASTPPLTDVQFYISGLPYHSGSVAYSSTVYADPVGGTAPFTYSWGILNDFPSGTASGNSIYGQAVYVDGTTPIYGGFSLTLTDANGTQIYRTITGLVINS